MRLFDIHVKNYFLVFIFFLLSQSSQALTEGKLAPVFSAKLLDGTSVSLRNEIGNVVILNFWATWCEPCRQEMPAFETYYKIHRSEGLRVITISMDESTEDAAVQKFMSQFTFVGAFSRDANFKGYGRIWRMPMTFIIDRKGILRKDGSVGESKMDLPLLEKLVTPLLVQKSD